MALSEAASDQPLSREAAEAVPARRMPFGRWMRDLGWRHIVVIVFVLFSLYPIAWTVSASLNPIDTLRGATLIPETITFNNYEAIFDNPELTPFMTWLGNTWRVSVVAALVNVFLATLAAYAFSRLRFRGRRASLISLLLVQVFPQFLAFIAIFLLLDQLNDLFPGVGTNTHTGLILVYLGGAIGFNAFLLKGFMDSVPASLDESARVDGASPFQIYWKIIVPLIRPAIAVVFFITFIGIYGEFILAQTLLRSTDQLTYAVGLRLFTQSDYTAKWGQLAAATIIGAAPIVITFLLAQRHIISGLLTGGVKG